ncbi:PCD23 protein, partial [Amia calva]|nr:PCD23 protein [Amia calva]
MEGSAVRTSALAALVLAAVLCAQCSGQVYNLTLSIEEGLPAGTIVGDIRAGLPEDTPHSGFFISESRESDVFRDLDIDGDSGIISTTAPLDRESRDRYEFVAATLTGEVIRVQIWVRDVNDHAPVFPRAALQLDVSEQSPAGTRFQLERARDQDEGEFGISGYRMVGAVSWGPFQLDYRKGGSEVFSLDLVLSGQLDREAVDAYSLVIEAFDGGSPPKTGRLRVEVSVLDENDNPPAFNQTEYRALVWENAPPLTPVCQVFATDRDLGLNGRVVYEINRRQSDPRELFAIDGSTGVIRVNKPLDYETQPFHELIVRARDEGAQPEYASTLVVVKVRDVNDNSPSISVMFLSESAEPEVSEGAAVGDYVARISVSDPDLGDSPGLRVSLEGGEGHFALKPSDNFLYFLCVDGPLDREAVDLYELKVVAADLGSPPLWSESTFLLRVMDENDSPPAFTEARYMVSVRENMALGTALLQVHARDRDEGVNAAVHYSIASLDRPALVSIDAASGLITTAARLDHEEFAVIRFVVVAEDGGSPPLSSTAAVTVHVEDINDNEPVFERQLYNVSIPEHSPVGSCFLQVTATDGDSGAFGAVRYSLYDGFSNHDPPQLFQIRPDSGELCVSRDVDRDGGLASHDVLVRAEDGGGLSAQTYVHISVEDINDHRPVFNPDSYVTSVSGHAQPGTEVLRVLAQTPAVLRRLSLDLFPGRVSVESPHGCHTLDSEPGVPCCEICASPSGVLYLTSTLSHLGASSVKLSVSARDGGGQLSPAPASITVHILRSGLEPAVFDRPRYSFSVPEDAAPGTSVGTVRATSPANSLESLSYRISSGDPLGLFSIHPQSGVLSTRRPLDHEARPSLSLVLHCQSGSSPAYSSTEVHVSVSDVNDNPPVFLPVAESISVTQGTAPGAVLYVAHAHDRDSGTNGRVRYLLRGGDSAAFAIDPRLGTLTLVHSLPPDGPPRYGLTIVAEDEGAPPLSATVGLSVSVERAAPDALAFETLVYQVEIGESTPPESRIIQVRAHGRWPHSPPSLSYSLRPDAGAAPFDIQAESGWLFLRRALDFEASRGVRFSVVASAREGGVALFATATVLVKVLDENDNAPVFPRDAYFFTVQEGPVPHGLVGTVAASDRDSGRNAQLSYILLSDGKHFRIDSKTGEIINWVALDRELQPHHSLTVLVTDHGLPRLNASVAVHILVTDVNDNPPQFTRLSAARELTAQVWAGQPAGTVVATLFAKDFDSGDNGTVLYTLSSEDGPGHFHIDGSTGEIKTTDRFSQRPRAQYSLSVMARDAGSPPLQQSALVHIQVLPNSDQGLLRFSVREDSKPGTVIGSARFPEARGGDFVYAIAEGDGSVHFGIDGSSGDLYLSHELDYETASHYLLKVVAEDRGQAPMLNASVFVSVAVEDVNDHAPWFPGDVLVFGVEENLPVSTAVYTFKANDGDGSLANSVLRYSLTSSSPTETPFLLDPLTGTLSTGATIDREEVDSWVLTVMATDQAADPQKRRHASLTTRIAVLDRNDNAPSFVSASVAQAVEDARPGSLVHHVIARDRDLGQNGRVAYRILSGNEKGVFALEETTGLLSLASTLDYKVDGFFSLVIQARDGGTPPLSSSQTLRVTVVDVNDEAPVFQQSVYRAAVPENQPPGTLVVRVAAIDGDSEPNAAVCYSLLPGPGFESFSINSHSGEISTAAALDRERQPHFTLRVLGRDSGVPALSSTATVLCSILDENDSSPEFTLPSLVVRVPENQPPGVIHLAQASDGDAGENGTLEYRISGDDFGGGFVVNATTGAVSVTRELDREEQDNYTLVIEAWDGGDPRRSSTATLLVHVLDENDNSPTFGRQQYRVSVSEGLPPGAEVLWLSASDPDEGPNGRVSYSLTGDMLGTFTVDSVSGQVRTARPLDRESRAQYVFRAVAMDGGAQGPRSSTVSVMVHLDDVNDNAPQLLQNLVRGFLSAHTMPNQTVATVRADDSDLGRNGEVLFCLAQPDPLFEIHPRTGDVWLKSPLPPGYYGTRLLQVIAADQGEPALSSTGLVLLHLRGEEPALWFTETEYEATIPENSKTGSLVVTVATQDQGSGRRGVRYSILSGNEDGAFALNPHTGAVSVKEPRSLDFERRSHVHLVVLASSDWGTAHCRVSVALQDVNDSPPGFEQAYYRTAVWEGQIHNTYVMQVVATDADTGPNRQLEYYILSGNENDAFLLDSVRGILATNAILDREIVPSYRLVLQAVDAGDPRLTGTTTVRVQVVDVNDNAPAIPPMEPAEIAENLPAGSIVTQVTANDVDLGSTLTYRFSEDGDARGRFAIDRYTGVVTLTGPLDYEEGSRYRLRVRASDSVHHTEADCSVLVLDVNDNPPAFSQDSYQVVLPELTPEDTFVLALTATDRDSGLNGDISYRLLLPRDKGFYISAENGSLYTDKPLRFLTDSSVVQLLVEARDGGDPPLTAVTSVEIHIQDANDHAPRFQQAAYQVSAAEDTSVGSTLLFLSASDEDRTPENAFLDYSIVSGNKEGRFCLEVSAVPTEARPECVARLVLCGSLDRETKGSYTLVVLASDRGAPALNGSVVVSVTVLDVNDNAPVFVSPEYRVEAGEGSPQGSRLTQVSARDADLGANAEVRYDIVSGNSKGLFRLDHRSGALEVNRSLDYEEDASFTLTVQAADGGRARAGKVAFAVIYVSILDENDNSPYFAFPEVNCSIVENQPAFSPVCAVRALDADAGPFGQLSYSVLSPCFTDYGSPGRKEAFTIDPLTGDIQTRQAFDYERESEYCLVVQAADTGDQTATVRVRIHIEGVDEFSPVFTQDLYQFELPEKSEVGQSVGRVEATDSDAGLDGALLFSLAEPSLFFAVNRTSGAIYVSGPVYRRRGSLRSREDLVELLVRVSSPKPDSKSTTCLVAVNVSSSVAEAFTGMPFSILSISLGVSLLVFLLLVISLVGLILRYRRKDVQVQKGALQPLAASLNPSTDTLNGAGGHGAIGLQDLRLCNKKEAANLCRHSDSSGRGSAEGDTAEDEEIQMINEHPCGKRSGSELSERASRVPDSGIPRDSDQLAVITDGPGLYAFQGGQVASGGSLASLVCTEEELRGSYSWDYLLHWEPTFQPLASVFSDIGQLQDEASQKRNFPKESRGLIYPPPLITAVAQPGIRAVPPRMPTLTGRPPFPKYAHSPLGGNSGLTPTAMTPSFSPSLSLLTLRTPTASPVVSEAGLGAPPQVAPFHPFMVREGEMQV